MAGNRRVLVGERACTLALCLACLWSICSAQQPAAAQATMHVVYLDAGDQARAERVRTELEASGYAAQIVSMPRSGEIAPQLTEATLREGARLGLGVRTVSGGCELLVYDAERDQIETYPLTQCGDAHEVTLAIRVVELLRASQLAVATEASPVLPEQPVGPPLSTAPVPAPAAARTSEPTRPASDDAKPAPRTNSQSADPGASSAAARSYAALELGIAVFGSPGGLGSGVAFALSTRAFLTRALRLGAYALLPLSAMKHEASEGSSRTRVTLVGLDLGGEFFLHSPLRTSLDGGFTVAVLATEGHSSFSDLSDVSTRRASAGAHLRGAVAYHFTRLLALRGALTIGAQFSPFAIAYADRTVAHWGLPWLSAQLLFELRFSGNS